MKKTTLLLVILSFILPAFFLSFFTAEESSLAQWESLSVAGLDELLAQTQSRPWRGQEYVPGPPGGTWNSGVTAEPKTFNLLVAERDAASNAIVRAMTDYLLQYDVVRRQWKPHAASPEVVVDEMAGTLKVIYTLRQDLYWSFYGSDRKIPVTSDDVIFWYDEIQGDEAFNSSSFPGQFVTMEDNTQVRITIEKIDEKRFSFNFPRIVADPLLSTNMEFGPRFVYEKAKQEGGVRGVLDLFSIASDPREIPSMGRWFLTEYVPGLRLVFSRNPDYWEKDDAGNSYPYQNENIVQILPDQNTQFLVFKEGRLDAYGARPEDLHELIRDQNRERREPGFFQRLFGRRNTGEYTVFNAEGALGAPFWCFNQNPRNRDQAHYQWFTHREFRQAMSCLLNRDRIAAQVFRGLAEPKLDFFPPPNPFFNPDITLEYLYNPQRAIELLASIGIRQDQAGVMRDWLGVAIEFDLSIPSDIGIYSDTASILADELAKLGIKLNVRPTDFQRLVEQLTATFDWSSIFIALGSNFFPSQGSNVWPSHAPLHLWYPNQPEPATDWEARIDYLYNEGSYTVDPDKARIIWDEFQRTILEEMPLIYLLRQRNFFAIQNRWDFANFYFDNLNGAETQYLFLRPR